MAVKAVGEKWVFELDATGLEVSWGYDSEDAATRAAAVYAADADKGGEIAKLARERALSGPYAPVRPTGGKGLNTGNLAAAHKARDGWDRG